MKKIYLFLIGAIMNMSNLHSYEIPSYKNIDFKPEETNPIFLDNKLKIYIKKDASLPTVRITLFLKAGKVYDPKDKFGMGELFFELLKEGGSKKFKSEEIDKKLEYFGAEISAAINNEDASVSMYSHKKNFDEVFEIFSDIIKNPAFEPERFELKKQEMIEMIKRRNDNPSKQATREALRMFFGKDHPYGKRPEIETVSPITVEDLKNYHLQMMDSDKMIMSVAGDFDEKVMVEKIKRAFSDIPNKKMPLPKIQEPDTVKGKKIYLIDKPLRQAFVVILNKGIKRHDPKEFPLAVLSEYMGGGIQSKLGNEIRSKRGLAYSVYSYFAKRNESGFIMTYLGTKPESVEEAIDQIFLEFKNAKEGKIETKELDMAKSQIINSFVFRFETVASLLNEIASYDLYSYPSDYIYKYTSNIDSVKIQDAINIAKEMYDMENYLIFIVGDLKKIGGKLDKFGTLEILKED
ncbi:MAG: pitrilysin family protein [Elusimicrobiota bacterium]